ncbi:hypothetical protein NPX13_g6090 [Xylaria arbuscula]|uniref:Uncharacterized protein n=1 Tax=Xylaria arbuscula TaxID=114810 RepID=A0A9W8NDJ6_9PEZI|nr:hypothetical protein NPX13_g6090 [Xylaria arbuscula]
MDSNPLKAGKTSAALGPGSSTAKAHAGSVDKDRRSDYTLTIATGESVNGGSFVLPGASLFTYNNGFLDNNFVSSYNVPLTNSTRQYDSRDLELYITSGSGYGKVFEVKGYITNNSGLAESLCGRSGLDLETTNFSALQLK